MSDKFSFAIDRSRGLVRITMAGFYTLEDIRDFVAARKRAHEELGWAPNAHLTLNDVREMKVQPQETVQAFQAMLMAPEYRSRRLAFVVNKSLAQAQLARAVAGREAHFFNDIASAERYLFAEASDAQPARRAANR